MTIDYLALEKWCNVESLMSTNKRRIARRHFQSRLQMRYGLQVNHQEWSDLLDPNHPGEDQRFIGRVSDTKTWWVLDIKGQEVLVLYDSWARGPLSCLEIKKLHGALEGNEKLRGYLGIDNPL